VASLSEACGASAIDEISPTVRQQLLTPQKIQKFQIRSPQHSLAHSRPGSYRWIVICVCYKAEHPMQKARRFRSSLG